MKIFVNENTDDLIKNIRKYVKNTNKSQTNIDTLDLCHMLGKIEYLEEKKRRLEINVLVNDKEIERLNNIINELEEELDRGYRDLFEHELVPGRELITNIKNYLQELKGSDKE